MIKEANNDAGLAAYPSARWAMNCVHFQMAMLAYNLNCWLMLFSREEEGKVETLKHTTLATSRLRFLFLAAKIWRHAGSVYGKEGLRVVDASIMPDCGRANINATVVMMAERIADLIRMRSLV